MVQGEQHTIFKSVDKPAAATPTAKSI